MQHRRLTAEQKEQKLDRQRRQRITKPAVNGQIRKLLPPGVEYLDLYETLLQNQNGVCGICGKLPGKIRFHMDHDHDTLEIRGLLCYSCNTKLAFVEKYWPKIKEYLKW